MIKFKRLTIALAALFIASATAWAQTTYNSGNIDVRTLKVGDILMYGVTLNNDTENWDALLLAVNRYAENGVVKTTGAGQTVKQSQIGADGVITYQTNNYTPISEDGTACKAWIVLEIEDETYETHQYKYIVIGGYEVPIDLTEVTAGTPLDLTEVTAGKQWKIESMPAANVTLNVEYEPEFTAIFKALTANTIGTAATVAVTEKDGTTAYTGATLDADGNYKPLYEGQTITLTAATGYKFRSVTATKVEAGLTYPIALSEVTADYLGSVIGRDAKVYATAADAYAAGVQADAVIAYIGSETDNTTYKHGLAISITDLGGTGITSQWASAKSDCEGNTAISGAQWQMPSLDQWKTMFKANGGDEQSYAGLNTVITTAGCTALQDAKSYWTSTQETRYNGTMDGVYFLYLDNKTVTYDWDGGGGLQNSRLGRAVLAF